MDMGFGVGCLALGVGFLNSTDPGSPSAAAIMLLLGTLGVLVLYGTYKRRTWTLKAGTVAGAGFIAFGVLATANGFATGNLSGILLPALFAAFGGVTLYGVLTDRGKAILRLR